MRNLYNFKSKTLSYNMFNEHLKFLLFLTWYPLSIFFIEIMELFI